MRCYRWSVRLKPSIPNGLQPIGFVGCRDLFALAATDSLASFLCLGNRRFHF
jgi:hypothetical protein